MSQCGGRVRERCKKEVGSKLKGDFDVRTLDGNDCGGSRSRSMIDAKAKERRRWQVNQLAIARRKVTVIVGVACYHWPSVGRGRGYSHDRALSGPFLPWCTVLSTRTGPSRVVVLASEMRTYQLHSLLNPKFVPIGADSEWQR